MSLPPLTSSTWPARIKNTGGLREQFIHDIDIVPTLLEVTSIPAPTYVDGIKQKPIEGTSFAYTLMRPTPRRRLNTRSNTSR